MDHSKHLQMTQVLHTNNKGYLSLAKYMHTNIVHTLGCQHLKQSRLGEFGVLSSDKSPDLKDRQWPCITLASEVVKLSIADKPYATGSDKQ